MRFANILGAAWTFAMMAGAAMAQEQVPKTGAVVTQPGAGASWGSGMLHAVELGEIITETNRDPGVAVLLVGPNVNISLSLAATGIVLETSRMAMTGAGCETGCGAGCDLPGSPDIRATYLAA